jgi:hypothetical protein
VTVETFAITAARDYASDFLLLPMIVEMLVLALWPLVRGVDERRKKWPRRESTSRKETKSTGVFLLPAQTQLPCDATLIAYVSHIGGGLKIVTVSRSRRGAWSGTQDGRDCARNVRGRGRAGRHAPIRGTICTAWLRICDDRARR